MPKADNNPTLPRDAMFAAIAMVSRALAGLAATDI